MDLSTEYMGLSLKSPLVASAGPMSQSVEKIQQMAEAGVGAVVLWSLFEEQIEHEKAELDYYLEQGTERFAESLSFFPEPDSYKFGADQYVDYLRKAKEAVDIPVIASLNGISAGGWIDYAAKLADAGADAIELNVYLIPTREDLTSERIEGVYLAILEAVKESVDIPVAMKLSPYFSSLANMARRLDDAGADALVLFNRFYQPDIYPDELEVKPRLKLSTSEENRLPLRWIAILRDRIEASLAATTGIHTAEDVAKMILAGADVTMMTSALLRNGLDHPKAVLQGLTEYASVKGYESVDQMRGVLSQAKCAEPAAFERANYMKTIQPPSTTSVLE
jgi:dihydroorotate dehydrogenase (fumarate)